MFSERPQAREYFLRGLFPDAARVVEHEFRGVDTLRLLVSAPEQNSGNFLGVVNVHLAAERLDIECAIPRWGAARHTRTACSPRERPGQIVKANIECLRHALRTK